MVCRSSRIAAAALTLLTLAAPATLYAEPPAQPAATPATAPAATAPARATSAPAASPAPAPAEYRLEAPLVDWSNAIAAHRLIESWTARGSLPGDEPVDPIRVTGATGARVTLRWGGRTVGSGQALAPDRAPGAAIDLAALTRSATNEALLDLTSLARSTTPKGGSSAALTPEQVAQRSMADLQIARELEPILISNNADDNAIYYQFIPGFHGLKMTYEVNGKKREAWLWPASALASRVTRKEQIHQLMRQLGVGENQLSRIARPLAADLPVSLYRFEVIHLVRPGKDLPPTLLQRGNVPLLPAQFTDRTLDATADRLAAHLVRRVRDDGGITGGIQPSTGKIEPLNGSDDDAALAAFVLGHRIRFLATHDAGNPRQLDADVAVRRLLKRLIPAIRKNDVAPPNAIALTLLTLVATPGLPDQTDVRAELANRLLALRDSNGRFRAAELPDADLANAASQALIVAALAAQNELAPDPKIVPVVQDWRRTYWNQRQTIFDVMSLPWAMATEGSYRRSLTAADPAAATQPATYATALAATMKAIRAHQITEPPARGPADVLGGFEIESQKKWLAPDPDWRSAFAVAFLATALREPGVIPPGDRPEWGLACGQGGRFLAQLMFDEASAFYVQSPEDAVGGERVNLWDSNLGIAPTAMALFASLQLQETLLYLIATGGVGR